MTEHRRDDPVDLSARVARLTAGQRACLDLVDDHATSKEIARQLGISRHTVDARLRQAIQILGVSSRREAAIIWRAAAGAQGYQPFAYQSSRLEAAGLSTEISGHVAAPDEACLADGDAPVGDAPTRYAPMGALPRGAIPHRPAVSPPGSLPGRAPVNQVADAASWALVSRALEEPALPAVPALRLWGGANDLTPGQRLAGMLIVMILGMLAFGLLLSGMAALVQLRT